MDWDLFPACRNEGPSCQTVEAFDVIVLIAVVFMLLLGSDLSRYADCLQEDALSNVSIVASNPERRTALPQRVSNCAGHHSLKARALDHMVRRCICIVSSGGKLRLSPT